MNIHQDYFLATNDTSFNTAQDNVFLMPSLGEWLVYFWNAKASPAKFMAYYNLYLTLCPTIDYSSKEVTVNKFRF